MKYGIAYRPGTNWKIEGEEYNDDDIALICGELSDDEEGEIEDETEEENTVRDYNDGLPLKNRHGNNVDHCIYPTGPSGDRTKEDGQVGDAREKHPQQDEIAHYQQPSTPLIENGAWRAPTNSKSMLTLVNDVGLLEADPDDEEEFHYEQSEKEKQVESAGSDEPPKWDSNKTHANVISDDEEGNDNKTAM